jgi:hypothetical protein
LAGDFGLYPKLTGSAGISERPVAPGRPGATRA